jgi:virulence-associated protein VagC
MAKARVVKMGKDQVVLFPKTVRIRTKEVEILRRGDAIVIREKPARRASERRKSPK